jgi:hypothetical protein
MSNQIINDTWNTWIMGSKSANIEIELRKWATINNVSIVSMYSKEGIINQFGQFQTSYRRNWIEKLLGIRTETVFFHLEGDYFKLCEFRDIIDRASESRHWVFDGSWPTADGVLSRYCHDATVYQGLASLSRYCRQRGSGDV